MLKTEFENTVIQTLTKCITACEICLTLAVQEGVQAATLRECINLQRDCIDICALTTRFIARSSSNMRRILRECIDICRKCAEECHKQTQEHYQQCGETCQECYLVCEKYLQKETAVNSKWL
jgi:hypothetical protein